MSYIENYFDIKKNKSLRDYSRSLVLKGLTFKDRFVGIENDLQKNRVQFLYIHHTFKDEEQKLERLLNRLLKTHTFVSYSEAVQIIVKGKIDKPYISISSDDGFKNNLGFAKILNAYNIKACFFINPAIIGVNDFRVIADYCKNRLNFPPVEFLNWRDIDLLMSSGHEIGSHTMNHVIMSMTEERILEQECIESYEIIREKCGYVRHFAFPYGRFFHFSELAKKIVFNSGYITCASAERGCHINDGTIDIPLDELCIRRDLVVLDRPLDEVFYFLASNSRKCSMSNNFFRFIS